MLDLKLAFNTHEADAATAVESNNGSQTETTDTSLSNDTAIELQRDIMEFMSSLQNGLDELKPSLFGMDTLLPLVVPKHPSCSILDQRVKYE